MKRRCMIFILILGMIACATLFGAPQKRTVQFMHLWANPAEKAIMDEVLGLFETKSPTIKVEQLVFGTGYHTKILQMLAGDTPPDVFLVYPGFNTFNLVDRNVLHPLTDMWRRYGLKQYFTQAVADSVSYKGDQWNLPWAAHANVVLYNMGLFKKIGVTEPVTLEEFERICNKAKSNGQYPLASGWDTLFRAAYPVELLLPALGGGEFYARLAALEVDWDNATVREMLAIWKRWVERGYWYSEPRSRSWPEGLGLVAQGLAVMDFIGTYGTSVLDDVGLVYGKDYDLFVFPHINIKFSRTFTGPFDALSIPRKAPQLQAAEELLAFMASTEAQSVRARAGGLVLNNKVTEYGPPMMKVRKTLEQGAGFVPGFFQASPPLGVELINKGAMVDFYENPDPNQFIQRANEARAQYAKEKASQ